jgi:hypothetical protein
MMLMPGTRAPTGEMARFRPYAGSSFHYTSRDFAVECVADLDAGRPVIVEVWDGLYGPGFYALDVGFDDATRDQLRWECFGDARPQHPMDGVLGDRPKPRGRSV